MLKRFLKRLQENEKGLTLIELLAVIVILGVIAAIAVPAISNIIDDSKDKAVVSDALQIINAAKIARASNAGVTEFVANGSTSTDNKDLDNYLESKIADAATNNVTVKITSTGWTIDGFKKLEDLSLFTDPTPESELTKYLQDGSTS